MCSEGPKGTESLSPDTGRPSQTSEGGKGAEGGRAWLGEKRREDRVAWFEAGRFRFCFGWMIHLPITYQGLKRA